MRFFGSEELLSILQEVKGTGAGLTAAVLLAMVREGTICIPHHRHCLSIFFPSDHTAF
jgi:hypothetical protein